jgi:hypothetical protein
MAPDRIWRGLAELQERYRLELEERRYRTRRHPNPRTDIRDARAWRVNDLDAIYEGRFARRRVRPA